MANNLSIHEVIKQTLEVHLNEPQLEVPTTLYQLIVNPAERSLLQVIMRHANGNQLKASAMLGINRNTLRKKLLLHGVHSRCAELRSTHQQ